MDQAKALFGDTNVTHGRPHLGTPLGSNELFHQFVADKVNQWTQELLLLSDIARAQPHTAFAAFTHGYIHKFFFLYRTTPNIKALLHPLEDCIHAIMRPKLTQRSQLSSSTLKNSVPESLQHAMDLAQEKGASS